MQYTEHVMHVWNKKSLTCFAGIPSDRNWFPSDRGAKVSFFQYMKKSKNQDSFLS